MILNEIPKRSSLFITLFCSSFITSCSDLVIYKNESVGKEYTHTEQNNINGNQVLHTEPRNKPYLKSKEATSFVKKYLNNAKAFNTDADLLRFASDTAFVNGYYIEMGVCTGKTINFIAALNPNKVIYGFDSFEGIPEDWVRNDRTTFKKGSFGLENPSKLPFVLPNVCLYKGWFSESLPIFKKQILGKNPISLIHIDCDVYSSTKDIFNILFENIIPGTIIVFDEFYNYNNYKEHEFKAFQEFLEKRNLKAKYIGFNQNHEQVAIMIVKE